MGSTPSRNASPENQPLNANVNVNVQIEDRGCGSILRRQNRRMRNSNGFWDYLYQMMKLFIMITSVSVGCVHGWYILLPIIFVAAGMLNINDCPDENILPISTAACGIIMCIYYFIYLVRRCCLPLDIHHKRVWKYINGVLFVLALICLVISSVFVYRNYKPDYQHFKCKRSFYDFMFLALCTIYVLPCFLGTMALLFALCYPRFKSLRENNALLG